MRFLIILFMLLFVASCNNSGSKAFQDLEYAATVETNTPSIDGPVIIKSFTPSVNPVTLVSGFNTFAIQLEAGAGSNVTYDFRFDGISVQNSTSPFFVISGAGVLAGAHTLEVIAQNSIRAASHTFNIFKNTPPVMNLVNTNPATPAVVSCIGGTFSMNTSASDVDGDPLTYSFYLNGATGSAALSNSSTGTTASTTFTPTCAMVGVSNIKIRATDTSGEYDEKTVSLTVSNPSMASITSFSPIANPTIIKSTDTQQFLISPDGTAPFSFQWTLTPGGVVAACANQSSCTFSGGGSYVGSYTLNVLLSDLNSTSASKNFNIIFNTPPAFTSSTYTLTSAGVPGTASPDSSLKFNCSDSVKFSVTLNDQNFGDAGQSHAINWTYGGLAVNSPSISSMFSVSTNVGTNPITSTLTFTPNCNSAALQGTKEIKVVATDGLESTQDTWDVYTSYMSTYCLNLTAGQICTLAGRPGLGNGLHTVNDATKIRIQPGRIIQGPDVGTYFISDNVNGMVWFYNDNSSGSYDFKSCTNSSCAPGPNQFTTTTVGPKRLVALVGTGVPGLGTVGQVANNFYLSAAGMAWDNTSKSLYIADYTNNRILKVFFDPTSSSTLLGRPQVFAGGSCTTIASCPSTNLANSTDTATAHKCSGPVSLALVGNDLYSTCYNNPVNEYNLKKFNISTLVGSNLVLTNVAITEGAMDGTAKAPGLYNLFKHPTQNALIISTIQSSCNIFVANISGTPSFYGPAVGGTIAPPANTFTRLTRNTTACNSTPTTGFRWDDPAGTFRAYSMYPRMRGGVMEGIYFTNNPNVHVGFLNLTNTQTITVGGIAVPPGFYARIWGNGTAGSARPASNASASTVFNNPIGAFETSSHLWVSDVNNYLIATLDTYVANGASGNALGYNSFGGFDGDGDISPIQTRFNEPTSLHYSHKENKLYISDTLNYRIRAIDLNVGFVKTELSNGASLAVADAGDNILPNANGFRIPRDIFFVEDKNTLLYSSGAANSLHVRAYNKNTSGTYDTLFGKDVNIGRVTTVAGRNVMGAANWVQGTMNGQIATAAPVVLNNLWGIVADTNGTVLRMANNFNSCILKVDSANIITQEIGSCGTTYPAGGPIIDGPFSSALFFNPRDMEIDPEYAADGNFFVVDGSLAPTALNGLRYVNYSNSTVTIKDPVGSDVDIAPGEIKTIVSGIGTFITGVAAFENWICYSQGAYATVFSQSPQNVVCFSRSPGYAVKTIGRGSSATVKGGIQLNFEHEGVDASLATLAEPSGIAFDSEGNLYIAERRTDSIRMVRRWW
jgi:hypothetical protein